MLDINTLTILFHLSSASHILRPFDFSLFCGLRRFALQLIISPHLQKPVAVHPTFLSPSPPLPLYTGLYTAIMPWLRYIQHYLLVMSAIKLNQGYNTIFHKGSEDRVSQASTPAFQQSIVFSVILFVCAQIFLYLWTIFLLNSE